MARITLMDGGLGQELHRRSRRPAHPLWSAKVMQETPELVRAVHADFIAAGARVITLNTYTATRPRLERAGAIDQLGSLHGLAATLAAEARSASGEDVTIAGCLPPLAGSYAPEAVPPFDRCVALYRELCALQTEHCDVLLAETLSTADEGRAAATAAAECGKPIWVAWTLRDHGDAHLRSGETLAAANAALDGLPVAARMVNCCHPESVDAALPALAATGGAWGAYANGFTDAAALRPGGTVDVLSARDDLTPERYADFALGWVAAGARLVGGCCEVSPAHIAELARRLTEAGHDIVALPD